ncbi:hypothetical protein ACED29_20935 [Shewanella sp. 5S214]|uniref:hypothetical protein n=1 Tax=Shewanella sp. 5S214 TaxID=3229999 RepID=UPI00352CE1E7
MQTAQRTNTKTLCEIKNPMKYEISIKFLDRKLKKNDLILLQGFTGIPLGELKAKCIESRVDLGTIVNEQFYSGVKEILLLLNLLESNYQLFSNSSEINKSFLENIAYKISNISLSDIR